MNHHGMHLDLPIQPQPTEDTCGPTCLQAIYAFDGLNHSLQDVIATIPRLPNGGTLAVCLGQHALSLGYQATLYTYNLQAFDPTWFHPHPMGSQQLMVRLAQQQKAKAHEANPRLPLATEAYIQYLKAGGQILFEDLSSRLLYKHLRNQRPILTGLSATYLYRSMRVDGDDDHDDDLAGHPEGHFVLIDGYDPAKRTCTVADPLAKNPGFGSQHYTVPVSRLVGAILLGVLTFDANLLILTPPDKTTKPTNA